MKKKYITYKDIISYNYCYDPQEIGMPVNYKATIPEFIQEYRSKVKHIDDILWVLARKRYITKKQACWFALKCARRVQHLVTDQRSIIALDMVEKYLDGKTTVKGLEIAKYEASVAYRNVIPLVNLTQYIEEKNAQIDIFLEILK